MKTQRGFTLIEVLIATTLLAVAALALLNTSHEQMRNLHILQQKQLAAWVAENQLALLTLSTNMPESGSVQLAGERWHWQLSAMPTTQAQVQRVDVRVWHEHPTGAPLVLMSTWNVK